VIHVGRIGILDGHLAVHPPTPGRDDVRRVCQNIFIVAREMRREWLDTENYEFGAV
jgi:hypothetical protein